MLQRINALKDLRGSLAITGISTNPARWKKDFLKNPDEDIMLELEDADLNFAKSADTLKAYHNMVEDIYDTMESVFGTRNDVSVTAFCATYEAMIKRPANYVDETLGLGTEALVLQYANDRILSADEYAVFRLKRIAQFEAEKEGISNA